MTTSFIEQDVGPEIVPVALEEKQQLSANREKGMIYKTLIWKEENPV